MQNLLDAHLDEDASNRSGLRKTVVFLPLPLPYPFPDIVDDDFFSKEE